MPTWKSPESAASLPSSTRPYDAEPAASWSATTCAISWATSAGPSDTGSASTCTAPVQPTPSAVRSCSTESAAPTESTLALPPVAVATCTASSTAHASWLLIVKPTKRASADCASSVSSTSPEKSGTRFTQTSTSVISSPHPLVAGVEQGGGVHGAHGHRVELLHVGDSELVADARLLRRQVGQQHVLAQRGRRAGGGHVGVMTVSVGEGAAVARQDRLAAEHVALGAARRGVVVDRHRAQHGGGGGLALSEVGLLPDEVGGLHLGPLHPGLDDGALGVELGAVGAVALLDAARGAVDADADGYGAVVLA